VSPSSSRIAGNSTRRGAGGVTRSSHQMIGSATAALSSHGEANASDPSESISYTLSFAAVRRQRRVQRQQRQMRRPVGAVGAKGPADRAGDRLQSLPMILKPAGIGLAD